MKNLNKRSKLTMCQATVSQVKQQANSRKKTVVYGTTDLYCITQNTHFLPGGRSHPKPINNIYQIGYYFKGIKIIIDLSMGISGIVDE